MSALPPRVAVAAARLAEGRLYFAPIRHHSPACARAVAALIAQVRPAAVLIEGPDSFDSLLPLLRDPRTRPPVAVLVQAAPEQSESLATTLFPFCDYSPEWVALRTAETVGAAVGFIDLPWRDPAWRERGDDSLVAERHLAHSAYVSRLARDAGCRDHDELWERLFELRPRAALDDWRRLFGDVFAYCAMARLDYEPEVLEAEGSLPRERHMAGHIAAWLKRIDGPIVVVTGGFHTLGLIELLDGEPTLPAASTTEPAWLIRYSFDRLDALNGYASGMPSPAYYQRVWEALASDEAAPRQRVAAELLTALAHDGRARDLGDGLSTAGVEAALLQAGRLAELRGHPGPGRYDLLDAIRSCFVKSAVDDGQLGLLADIRRVLGGSRLGEVPPSAASPPLLEDARRLARRYGVRLDDSTPRQTRLDLYRKPSHCERSRFFHLSDYLSLGLAQWQGGPDFMTGQRLDLLFEEWRVAWTPLVEARLVELASEAASLETLALTRLQAEEAMLAASGRAGSASTAVQLLLRACLIGLHGRLPMLFELLSAQLDQDADFVSVVDCGHTLLTLWRAREPLGVQRHPALAGLLQRIWPAALYLLPGLAGCAEDAAPMVVSRLLALRELGRLLATDAGVTVEIALWQEGLERLAREAGPELAGAAGALRYLDGDWDEAALGRQLDIRFGFGAEPREAVRFLSGVMAAAPELLLRVPALAERIDSIVTAWDEQTFVAHLPDLRQTFTRLKPQETASLAGQLARRHGGDGEADWLDTAGEWTEQELLAGTRLELALHDCLAADGLAAWKET
ncbi:DUF5682 family protein [Chitinimonas lacunae]|uniref:DUF5682 family protein n=1 Tax=Chitinimonas lacunae TaxID=1963018 RepID=A0ABV8MSI2_9NEIS